MAAGDGLVTMTPTSIVVAGAGSSASINADGGVDFTSATSLSLNGVFTSSFDNYLIVLSHSGSTTTSDISFRLRAAGTDASGSNYTWQYLLVDGTSSTGARTSSTSSASITISGVTQSGTNVAVYGPYLAQPTAWRSVTGIDVSGALMYDIAATHSLSTSYDGFTIYQITAGRTNTGTVHVFGYEE